MSLEGTETVLKLTGSAAKHLAIMLYAVIKDQEKSSGQTRLANMLKSGKELKIFAIKDENLETFHKEAKHYGILYTTIKNKTVDDGSTDIMIKAEDAAIVNRLFERLKLMTADKGQVKAKIEESIEKKPLVITDREDLGAFVDAALSDPKKKAANENPSQDLTGASRQSSPGWAKESGSRADSLSGDKPSVKKAIEEIRKEQEKTAAKKNRSRSARIPKKGQVKEHGR